MSCFSAGKQIYLVDIHWSKTWTNWRLLQFDWWDRSDRSIRPVWPVWTRKLQQTEETRKKLCDKESFSVHMLYRHLLGSCTSGSKRI